ncbi:hypothetical protein IMSHALPRED_001735 [Imshaugia aleurites]|uniref:Uncharacterized protein n=1 Tax=Imshaugia aleurites TaxID=172621 RepID=A0A8H3J3T2_9LECA|nr:hypothetical protein IMSHALPRED_001735 [Imshaugia aleurites]
MTSPPTPQQDSSASSLMWPVDYILNSDYSPLRIEKQLPEDHWRDAFEDLLALEANGEMISLESRRTEKDMAVKIIYRKASNTIYAINRNLRTFAGNRKRLLELRKNTGSEGDARRICWVDDMGLPENRSDVDRQIKTYKLLTQAVERQKHWSASQNKHRGQWIASLISSGVLPGWSSRLESNSWLGEPRMFMQKLTVPRSERDEKDSFAFTDNGLYLRFRVKEPLQKIVHSEARRRSDFVIVNDHDLKNSSSDSVRSRQNLIAQTTTSERILLADGSIATKVVLTNHARNGREEKIEIIEDAAKVLEEVEKARNLMRGRSICW